MMSNIARTLAAVIFAAGLFLHVYPAAAEPDQGITSAVHKKNIGGIVWSKSEVKFRAQGQAKLVKTFQLSDPIFGRIYLRKSLANTPVFSGATGAAVKNNRHEYETKLFIDGKNVPVRFGVFSQGRLRNEATKWTTWQIIPNPSKAGNNYPDAKPWRKATIGLAAGKHKVRFELWATLGQFRSKTAIAKGGFTLLVKKGDNLALQGRFPSDSYSGSDVNKIRSEMRRALLGPVAKNANDIIKVSVAGPWRKGRYTDTKASYRKITVIVLWRDTNSDKICRYVSYSFISNYLGSSRWARLRFRAFVNGGREGNVACR